MRLGINLGYFGAAAPSQFVPMVQRAEALGYHSVWTAEAYGSDSIVPLIWAGAHTTKINLGTAINTAGTAKAEDFGVTIRAGDSHDHWRHRHHWRGLGPGGNVRHRHRSR